MVDIVSAASLLNIPVSILRTFLDNVTHDAHWMCQKFHKVANNANVPDRKHNLPNKIDQEECALLAYILRPSWAGRFDPVGANVTDQSVTDIIKLINENPTASILVSNDKAQDNPTLDGANIIISTEHALHVKDCLRKNFCPQLAEDEFPDVKEAPYMVNTWGSFGRYIVDIVIYGGISLVALSGLEVVGDVMFGGGGWFAKDMVLSSLAGLGMTKAYQSLQEDRKSGLSGKAFWDGIGLLGIGSSFWFNTMGDMKDHLSPWYEKAKAEGWFDWVVGSHNITEGKDVHLPHSTDGGARLYDDPVTTEIKSHDDDSVVAHGEDDKNGADGNGKSWRLINLDPADAQPFDEPTKNGIEFRLIDHDSHSSCKEGLWVRFRQVDEDGYVKNMMVLFDLDRVPEGVKHFIGQQQDNKFSYDPRTSPNLPRELQYFETQWNSLTHHQGQKGADLATQLLVDDTLDITSNPTLSRAFAEGCIMSDTDGHMFLRDGDSSVPIFHAQGDDICAFKDGEHFIVKIVHDHFHVAKHPVSPDDVGEPVTKEEIHTTDLESQVAADERMMANAKSVYGGFISDIMGMSTADLTLENNHILQSSIDSIIKVITFNGLYDTELAHKLETLKNAFELLCQMRHDGYDKDFQNHLNEFHQLIKNDNLLPDNLKNHLSSLCDGLQSAHGVEQPASSSHFNSFSSLREFLLTGEGMQLESFLFSAVSPSYTMNTGSETSKVEQPLLLDIGQLHSQAYGGRMGCCHAGCCHVHHTAPAPTQTDKTAEDKTLKALAELKEQWEQSQKALTEAQESLRQTQQQLEQARAQTSVAPKEDPQLKEQLSTLQAQQTQQVELIKQQQQQQVELMRALKEQQNKQTVSKDPHVVPMVNTREYLLKMPVLKWAGSSRSVRDFESKAR